MKTKSTVLLLLTASFCLFLARMAEAANIVSSPDEGSLRAAIALGGWVGINFNGTLTISNTINITNKVVLDASGVSATISGGNAVRLFTVASGASLTASNLTLANGTFLITNGPPGTLADGGAIYNNGTLSLVSCTLSNNAARSYVFGGIARGGAVFNDNGTMSLFQSLIVSNLAAGGGPGTLTYNDQTASGLGGALYNTNGTVTINRCSINGNVCNNILNNEMSAGVGVVEGGGTYQASGVLTILNSSFTANQALGGTVAGPDAYDQSSPAYGGGVAVVGGSLSIENSQFYLNQACGGDGGRGLPGPAYGGAVYSSSAGTAVDSAFSGNQSLAGNYGYNVGGATGYGGALYNSGTFLLSRCSIYSNSVYGGAGASFAPVNGGDAFGGGVYNLGLLAATNCTIAVNWTAGGEGGGEEPNAPSAITGSAIGGGIFNHAGATFIGMNLTFAGNLCSSPSDAYSTNGFTSGFQVANTNGALALHNSIIAYSGTNANAYGPITDDGYNISSDGSANFTSGSSYNNTDPQLAPLGNYGGPTLCMALLATSPAIDSADPADFPPTDQRGYVRPAGNGPDVGAYEYGAAPPSLILNIRDAGPNLAFNFTTTTQGMYVLQSSTNLTTWTDVSTSGPISGTTNITQMISKQSTGGSYFRLMVQ